MRFRLRTLLIVLTILPPLLATGWWSYTACKSGQERQHFYRQMVEVLHDPMRLPDMREPQEVYAWLLPRAPIVIGFASLAFFVAVVVVAMSSGMRDDLRPTQPPPPLP